ncbi:helix-turn-helix domain-containing protein, partial [Candidatus Bipolaricaulota bacterium]|nr:helix-turn-helix domain-containing protein [Candidatus Bipolaricaulota bacterium]
MTKRMFGELVRAAREEKGLSLRALADQAGLDYSRLARIEQGTRPSPDLATTRSLAEALDLDLATLLVSA